MEEPTQPTTNSTLQYTPKVVQSIDANFSEQIRTSNGSLRSSQDKPDDTKQNVITNMVINNAIATERSLWFRTSKRFDCRLFEIC